MDSKSYKIDAVTIKTICDWISSFIKQSGLTFYFHTAQQSVGEMSTDESGHLSIFTLLQHLMMLLTYTFFRASFLHLNIINDADSMYGHAAHFLYKVNTLLKNAFK